MRAVVNVREGAFFWPVSFSHFGGEILTLYSGKGVRMNDLWSKNLGFLAGPLNVRFH
jgi:hypothetical protein